MSLNTSSESTISRQYSSPVAKTRGDLAKRIGFGISNAQAVTLPTLTLDAFVVIITCVIASVGYNIAAFGNIGDIYTAFQAGVLLAIAFCCITRLKASQQPVMISLGFERGRDGLFAWVATFGLLLFLLSRHVRCH